MTIGSTGLGRGRGRVGLRTVRSIAPSSRRRELAPCTRSEVAEERGRMDLPSQVVGEEKMTWIGTKAEEPVAVWGITQMTRRPLPW